MKDINEVNNISEENTSRSLEESFERLGEILDSLEKTGISLEESFAKYDEGLLLVKECQKKLDMYEKRLIQVNEVKEDE